MSGHGRSVAPLFRKIFVPDELKLFEKFSQIITGRFIAKIREPRIEYAVKRHAIPKICLNLYYKYLKGIRTTYRDKIFIIFFQLFFTIVMNIFVQYLFSQMMFGMAFRLEISR